MIIIGSPLVTVETVESEPDETQSPVVAPAQRFTIAWTGTDGTEWNLSDGPVTVASGASGFGMPSLTHWHDEAPTVDGASWQGVRVPPRELFLPLHVRASSATEMQKLESAFFAGLDPRLEGTLRVVAPDATWREIRARYVEGSEGEYDVDPLLLRYAPYAPRLVAADPYWCSEESVTVFENEAGAGLFPGPPFTIGKANTLDNAAVTNPGDVGAHAVWRVTGPCTAFEVGIAGAPVAATLTLLAGEWVEIDMHPTKLTVLDNTGADRWDDVTAAEFEAIPPGLSDLTASVTGAGVGTSVSLTFTPRFWRAW